MSNNKLVCSKYEQHNAGYPFQTFYPNHIVNRIHIPQDGLGTVAGCLKQVINNSGSQPTLIII